ncbi:cation efflux family protein [Diplogelasinospora grovesii]|uniref:Cation efflux family protein n=1 Tax=Diplogelasinospora grovesii TaxID=303347 RepID=A0AAN6NFP0_9PEZI|nr:cation efflux family protein [Diplogelasinospora grovesii]
MSMMAIKLDERQRLTAIIIISLAFFIAELIIAFKTRSLALQADAFHYLTDLISYVLAWVAIYMSEKSKSPQDLSFGWQRAKVLGALCNGVFLFGLGFSILLQSVERFIALEEVENPKLILIMGSVGLTLNIISVIFLHEHHHDHGHSHSHSHEHDTENGEIPASEQEVGSQTDGPATLLHPHAEHRHAEPRRTIHAPGRDLGMLGVMMHVTGDALNNLGVIVAALIIWLTSSPSRFYADPGVGVGIAVMILLSAIPVIKNSGIILLQSAPVGVDLDDIKHDIEKIPGIESVHELHVWRLDQKKAIASAHVVVSDGDISNFMEKARTVRQCLHAYGIHSATIQPEFIGSLSPVEPAATETVVESSASASVVSSVVRRRNINDTPTTTTPSPANSCQMLCGKGICESLMCCRTVSI